MTHEQAQKSKHTDAPLNARRVNLCNGGINLVVRSTAILEKM